MEKIVLASASPRRRELLHQIGIEFEVRISDKEEKGTEMQSAGPEEICINLAKQKALDVWWMLAGQATVIGADTIVVLDGEIFGKPRDEEHAAQMLRALSGRAHQVYTGVCVVREDSERTAGQKLSHPANADLEGIRRPEMYTFAEKTDVYVADLSEEDIRAYIATGDPMDKAGAYGIQGVFARHIRKIDGDYFNVVGLPIGRLWRECLGM